MLKSLGPFLSTVMQKLQALDLSLQGYQLDHACYRTDSLESYARAQRYFEALGLLLVESQVGGRMISTYKLRKSIRIGKFEIPLIEVPSPKTGSPYPEGWEHVEAVIDTSLEEFLKLYPHLPFDLSALKKERNRDVRLDLGQGISIKFHEQSLEEVIKSECSAD